MEKIEITIGFKYSRLKSGNMSYENYWESFEVVGVLYSDGYEVVVVNGRLNKMS